MLRQTFVAVALALVLAPAASAQEWIEFVERTDRFSINFPGQPSVRDITYDAQRGSDKPGRVYTVQDGPRRYSVTVVDFANSITIEAMGTVAWEAWNFRKRGGVVTYDAHAQVDRIEGHQMHITNPDGTVSFIGLYFHARRLYVLEARVPPESPGAVHFQQSLMILDADGQRIRYEQDDDGVRTTRIMDLTGIC